jgi:hypothetical protein
MSHAVTVNDVVRQETLALDHQRDRSGQPFHKLQHVRWPMLGAPMGKTYKKASALGDCVHNDMFKKH